MSWPVPDVHIADGFRVYSWLTFGDILRYFGDSLAIALVMVENAPRRINAANKIEYKVVVALLPGPVHVTRT